LDEHERQDNGHAHRQPGLEHPARRRIGGEGQKHGKGQMERARLGVVEDADSQHEGQWRGDPELEQGPCQRDQHDEHRDRA